MYAIIEEYNQKYQSAILENKTPKQMYIITDISQIEEKYINNTKWYILHTPQTTIKLHTTYNHIKIFL